MYPPKTVKVILAVIFIFTGALSASAQKRDNNNRGQREQNVHNRDARPQKRNNPQRQPTVNRTPVNRIRNAQPHV